MFKPIGIPTFLLSHWSATCPPAYLPSYQFLPALPACLAVSRTHLKYPHDCRVTCK